MSEWKKVTLDKMGVVSRGKSKHRPRNDARLFGGKYPFIQTGDIGAAGLYVQNYSQTYNEEGLAQSKLWDKDTLCITIAANIADTALLAFPACFPDSVMGFVPYKNVSNVKFVKYCFDILKKDCQQISQGTAQDNLSWKKLSTILFPCPPIEVQNRIVEVLSRYDTLIENYQKQIKLLEEAAQRLYKEWFVELRFPGHENTKMVDGLPEGWERKKLVEFGCSLESGARPKGGVDSNLKDGIPSVGAENVIGLGKYNYSSEKLVTNQFYSQMRKGKIKDRDILIYKDGAYIGRTSLFQDVFPHKEMAVNEHVFLLHTLNENYQYYVFFTLYQKQYFEKMQKLNKNAAQPGLNQKALLDLVMLCPSENFVLSFRIAIEPLMKALFSKANQIRLLTEARDRLLPRLMGGEMEV